MFGFSEKFWNCNYIALPFISVENGTCHRVSCPSFNLKQRTVSSKVNPAFNVQQGDKCRLSYNGGGPGDISVAISLLLEDYPRASVKGLYVGGILQNITDRLSTSEMQFLVYGKDIK